MCMMSSFGIIVPFFFEDDVEMTVVILGPLYPYDSDILHMSYNSVTIFL